MLIRIRKDRGWWKAYAVYFQGTEGEYEVFLERFSTWEEAYKIARETAGIFQ
jgi:hypothetical protein